MGCDIHFVIEEKVGKKWIGISSTDHLYWPPSKQRNYQFFAEIAGVRGEGQQPRGIPADASQLTKLCLKRWNGDAHSNSYMSVKEFVKAWIKVNGDIETIVSEESQEQKCLGTDFFMYADEGINNFRVVFWFDN